VPRCFTVTTCVQAGNSCATSADCCNGNVCVPDGSGHYVCGATSCVPTGGKCTATSDCCPGQGDVCIIPPGQTTGVCGNPTPPPADGGMPPQCSHAGQTCSTTQPCCVNEGACENAMGQACTTATGCTCVFIPIP
jgi:hypothetical protein